MNTLEIVGYFAMGASVLSFAFAKQKLVRIVNLLACLIWVYYGFLIQNNPTIIVNVMVSMVHLYWFVNRWCRIKKLNRK
jgi:uncharacterized protein with PQ loop repeat